MVPTQNDAQTALCRLSKAQQRICRFPRHQTLAPPKSSRRRTAAIRLQTTRFAAGGYNGCHPYDNR